MMSGSSPGNGSSQVCICVKGCQTCALSSAARRMMADDARPSPKTSSTLQWVEDGILVVKLEQLGSWNDMRTDVARLQPEIAKARALILDARQQPPLQAGIEDVGDELGELLP